MGSEMCIRDRVSKGLNARTIEEFDVDALIYAEVVVVTIFRCTARVADEFDSVVRDLRESVGQWLGHHRHRLQSHVVNAIRPGKIFPEW